MIGGAAIKGLLGPKWTTWARTVTRGLERPAWGNLRRVTPISATYGFDQVPSGSYDAHYWHASADGWRVVAARVWPDCDTTIETHGNCLAAAAAMYGIAVEELTASELDVNDPRYPVLVTIACRTR